MQRCRRYPGPCYILVPHRGRLAFMIFRQRFTARVLLNFLGRLLHLTRNSRPKIFPTADGHLDTGRER